MPLNPPQAYRKTEFTHRRGERINQPLASDVLTGTLYYVVDEGIVEISDGTNWQPYVGQGANTSTLVNYSYSIATGTPPGANQVRFNAAFPYTAVTRLYFWNITADGQNIKVGLLRVQPGAVIYIQKKNDDTQWASFQVTTDPIDHTTWTEYVVVHVNHGSAIGGGQLVLVQAGPGPTYAPPPHAPSHETGGSDALAHLSAAILDSGLLPDARLNNTAVTPGSYTRTNLTVDSKGRLTAAASGTVITDTFSRSWSLDGGGAVLSTGVVKKYIYVPVACTIVGWTLMSDQVGAVQLDVFMDNPGSTYPPTTSIVASAPPALVTSDNYEHNTTLTGWTTSVSAGRVLGISVTSVATIQELVFQLDFQLNL